MPSPKGHKNSAHSHNDTHRKGRLGERSSSFHGQNAMSAAQLCRPRTVPDLLSYRNNHAGAPPEGLPRQPPKLLLKVTVLGSLAPLQVLIRPESTVGDLAAAAVQQYLKEGRRPMLPANNASDFDLHYSQFSLESLEREEKVIELGSRNFFLCPKKANAAVEGGRERSVTTPFASCAKEVDRVRQRGDGVGVRGGFAWFKLMQFLL